MKRCDRGENRADSRHPRALTRRLVLVFVLVGAIAAALGWGATDALATTILSEGFNSADADSQTLPTGWTSDAPNGAGDFWHDQINPQTISVIPAINPALVTLPDSGALPSAFEGDGVAWYGEASTGTYCGDDPDADPPNSYTDVAQPADDGCTSEQIEDGDLDSPPFSLSSTATSTGSVTDLYPSAQLTFEGWWDIEAVEGDAFDVMTVSYSIDGGSTWTALGTLNPDNPTGGLPQQDYTSGGGIEVPPQWKPYLVDLTPVIEAIQSANADGADGDPTDSAQLQFNFDTGDTLYNGFRGWLLDQVQVSEPYGAGPPAISSVSPSCLVPGDQSSVITLTGTGIPTGSSVDIDPGTSSAQTVAAEDPSDTTAEFTDPGLAAGTHVLQIVTSSGATSNAVDFTVSATCESPSMLPIVSPGVPSVSTTGAGFTAAVNPNGSATSVYFEYGLDPKYGLTTASDIYVGRTPVEAVGSGSSPKTVFAGVTGLVPDALYHVRAVAANAVGTVTSADQTFTTAALAPPPAPVLGQEANFTPVSGIVYVKPPAGASIAGVDADRAGFGPDLTGHAMAALTKGMGFIPLTEARQLPVGTEVDARAGTLRLITATTARKKGKRTQTESGEFSEGLFQVAQSDNRRLKGLTLLKLLDSGIFPGAPSYKKECAAVAKTINVPSGVNGDLVFKPRKLSKKALQTLKASEHGNYRTQGKYSAATVRGTIFTVTDRCDGTLTVVKRGLVVVTDFRRHKNITLHTNQRYLATAP